MKYHVPYAMLLLVLVLGCGKDRVKVKQDTPQAAVATLIKGYGVSDKQAIEQVIDPLFTRAFERRYRCTPELVKDAVCVAELLRDLQLSRVGITSSQSTAGCPVDVEGCACQDAGALPTKFIGSPYDRGMTLAGLSPERCKIVGVLSLSRGADFDQFEDVRLMCDELAPNETMSAVNVKCASDYYAFALRRVEEKWMIFSLDMRSAERLLKLVVSEMKEKEIDELNADLK